MARQSAPRSIVRDCGEAGWSGLARCRNAGTEPEKRGAQPLVIYDREPLLEPLHFLGGNRPRLAARHRLADRLLDDAHPVDGGKAEKGIDARDDLAGLVL